MAFSCKAMKNFKILFSGCRSLPKAKVGVKSRMPSFGVCFVAVPLILSLSFVSACIDSSDTSQIVTIDGPAPAEKMLLGMQLVSASGKYLAGRYARRSRDFGTAADYLSDALSIDTSNHEIRQQTFFALVSGGRMAEAAVLAKEIVDTDKGAAVANLSLVVEDAFASRFDAAAKRLDPMPRRGMSMFAAPLLLAWAKAALGDTEGAIKSLDELKSIASFAALRHMHVGLIYEQAGKMAMAKQALKKASEGTVSIRIVMGFGHFLERQGRVSEAEALYKRYAAKNNSDAFEETLERIAAMRPPPGFVETPKDGLAEVFFNLAGILAQGQSSDLAVIYGRMALRLRPDFPLAQLLLGGLLESLSRGADAIALYKKVNPKSPVSWSARLRQASNLDEMGKTEEAIALLERMAAERKDRFEPLIRIGDSHRSKKKFDDAVGAYDRALQRVGKLEKNHWALFYARGIAFERAKEWQNAEKDLLQALKLSPEQPFVLNYLGYSWVDQGVKLNRAKKMIRRAAELRPNDGYIIDSLGWVLYRLGDYPEAAKNLERAVVLKPEDPTINDHLGDAYWRVGRKFEARFQWKRALSLDPGKDLISQIEEKLRDGLKKIEKGNDRS